MFEKSKPVSDAFYREPTDVDWSPKATESASEDASGNRSGSGDALRAIEWSELTARLNAARELRRELREEAILCAGASGATFGDAAASLFNTLGDGQRHVNPDGLEACKASRGISVDHTGVAAKGDARDEI